MLKVIKDTSSALFFVEKDFTCQNSVRVRLDTRPQFSFDTYLPFIRTWFIGSHLQNFRANLVDTVFEHNVLY